MRDFSKVSPAVWESKRFHALSDDGRFALLYLMTSPHQNSAGCYRLPLAYAAADLQWPVERVQTALQELSEADMVTFDPSTDVLLIHRWFRHNPPQNEKHLIGIRRTLDRLPSEPIRAAAMAELETVLTAPPKVTAGAEKPDNPWSKFRAKLP